MTPLRTLARRELLTILLSVIFTFIAFIFLAILRLFDDTTFSFLQILLVTMLVAIFVYGLSFIPLSRFTAVFHGRELAITLVVFTILSFTVLNIDRSRSFYLLKWVSIAGNTGTSTADIAEKYNLTGQDFIDIRQRIEEQKESGSITEVDGKLKLTFLGKLIVNISTFTANFANLSGYPRS